MLAAAVSCYLNWNKISNLDYGTRTIAEICGTTLSENV